MFSQRIPHIHSCKGLYDQQLFVLSYIVYTRKRYDGIKTCTQMQLLLKVLPQCRSKGVRHECLTFIMWFLSCTPNSCRGRCFSIGVRSVANVMFSAASCSDSCKGINSVNHSFSLGGSFHPSSSQGV